MMHIRSKPHRYLLPLAGIALACFAFYNIRLLFLESLYMQRGTYAYLLTVSSLIKNVPEVRSTGEAVFYSSAGDGPKLPEDEIRYTSSAEPSLVKRQIAAYLHSRGYREANDSTWQLSGSRVDVTIEPASPGHWLVRVSETR